MLAMIATFRGNCFGENIPVPGSPGVITGVSVVSPPTLVVHVVVVGEVVDHVVEETVVHVLETGTTPQIPS